ncbi:MAG: L-histidine N(alpha)-methyltransferase [Myxococcales bacterium]|nr:L-histidine N(alpha)-methyltransferase [Myxococcales bacterium]
MSTQPAHDHDHHHDHDRAAAGLDPWCCGGCMRLRQTVNNKTISIHMLYEDGGSELYEAIEAHPDYYLYATEKALLERHAADIVRQIRPGSVLIELGCGDCTKTDILVREMVKRDGRVDFIGVDSSLESLTGSAAAYEGRAGVAFTPVHDNFFDGLAAAVQGRRGRDVCVLFLGSTIGNMSLHDSQLFLRTIAEIVHSNTLGRSFQLVLGIDMWKDPEVLQRAYDNETTRDFELNGLRNSLRHSAPDLRFDPDEWRYDVHVNPELHQVEMYAVSLREQRSERLHFAEGERILLEVSHKFTPAERGALCDRYEPIATFGDAYQIAVLRSAAPAAAANPWMSSADAHVEHIDRVAAMDYDAFVLAYGWSALGGGAASLRVLDVGCGSGFVPRSLLSRTPASRRLAGRIAAYDLLDVSANSLRIAAGKIPFPVTRKVHASIQEVQAEPGYDHILDAGYDVVWAIHGITAVPRAELGAALRNMLSFVKPGGEVLVVLSDHDSHYSAIDRAYLTDRRGAGGGRREPFLVADDVLDLLRARGVDHQVVRIETAYAFPLADAESWRHFNAWCVYDDAFDVAAGGPAVRAYVDGLVDREGSSYRLRLTSTAITIRREPATLSRLLAARA